MLYCLPRLLAVVCGLLVMMPLGAAVERPPRPAPVVVAESDLFEAVGRLEAGGLSFFIDRADSNAPVLDAVLTVDADGQSATAAFRPATGDYWIPDGPWLQGLRRAGEHPLSLTLVAGEESDLLGGILRVEDDPAARPAWPAVPGGMLAILLALGLGGLIALRRFRRRIRRSPLPEVTP